MLWKCCTQHASKCGKLSSGHRTGKGQFSFQSQSKDKLKGLWWRSKRKERKSWLETQYSKTEDHGIQSHHFMANKWRKCGNSVRFRFLGLQNQCRWWCSHKIKRHLLLEEMLWQMRKCIKKQRHHFAEKVKNMIFPVVMYGCESWTIKKAERQRTDAFKLWY